MPKLPVLAHTEGRLLHNSWICGPEDIIAGISDLEVFNGYKYRRRASKLAT